MRKEMASQLVEFVQDHLFGVKFWLGVNRPSFWGLIGLVPHYAFLNQGPPSTYLRHMEGYCVFYYIWLTGKVIIINLSVTSQNTGIVEDFEDTDNTFHGGFKWLGKLLQVFSFWEEKLEYKKSNAGLERLNYLIWKNEFKRWSHW